MRERVDRNRLQAFMRALAEAARHPLQVYLVGGATAVVEGWRLSTVDVDLRLGDDADAVLRAIPAIKERLNINIELASPADFIPVKSGWEDRSPFVAQEGPVTFRHFDLYAQALSKVERNHDTDRRDVAELIGRGLVERQLLQTYFDLIEPDLYRFPAIDAASFRRAVEAVTRSDSTQRFSDRVADYVRFRPGYPAAMIDTIESEAGLSARTVVADIGSGTGISSELLLGRGCTVFAVEPNDAMRAAAERALGQQDRFHSIAGSAERTTLPDGSVDGIAAGQAFHWFDVARARPEFLRILRPGGWVALFWNERQNDADTFMLGYEALLRAYATDYGEVDHRNVGAKGLQALFGHPYQTRAFPNEQVLDCEGLRGRLLSASYAPKEGHPRHRAMLDALHDLFEKHQTDGHVRFVYETRLHFGPIASSLA